MIISLNSSYLKTTLPCDALFLLLALLAFISPAHAINVNASVVKSGYFTAPDCRPEADPKIYNECLCEADIKKAVISGATEEVVGRINEHLAMLPEKLAVESCDGEPTEPSKNGLKVNKASADYEVAYQTDTTLTVLITYSTYGVGAEHPLDGTEGFTFDLTNGKLLDPISYLNPDELIKADTFIKSELMSKYPAALYEEVKERTDPYLTENGCDTCTLFYGKDGWIVRFQITAIAPYMIGEPEVVIPTDIIPPPEKFVVKG